MMSHIDLINMIITFICMTIIIVVIAKKKKRRQGCVFDGDGGEEEGELS